jgi:hypothetical protein
MRMREKLFTRLDNTLTLVKPIVVRLVLAWNFSRFRPYVKSYLRLVFVLTQTYLRGYWNALLVQQRGTAPDTLLISYAISDEADDPERFLAQIAMGILENPSCKDIDLLLLGNDARPLTTYSAIARLFGHRLNLQLFTSAQALADIAKTMTDMAVLPGLAQWTPGMPPRDAILVRDKAVGCLRLPLLSKNTAREYLKSIDVTGQFCAISLPADTRPVDAQSLLAGATERHPDWQFLLLNDEITLGGLPLRLPSRVLMPSRAGFDLLTRLCLAAEVDAYVGVEDVFGLTAYLAGKPARLLRDVHASVNITAAPPKVDCSPQYSDELLSQNIEMLLSYYEQTQG